MVITVTIIGQTFVEKIFPVFLSFVDFGQEILWIIIIQSRGQILSKVKNIQALEFSKESFLMAF